VKWHPQDQIASFQRFSISSKLLISYAYCNFERGTAKHSDSYHHHLALFYTIKRQQYLGDVGLADFYRSGLHGSIGHPERLCVWKFLEPWLTKTKKT